MRVLIVAAVACGWLSCGAAANAAPLSVTQLKAAPPASGDVDVVGYVTGTYICPPCPPGAMCKPCVSPSAIFISDSPPVGEERLRTKEIRLEADPSQYQGGAKYEFHIVVRPPSTGIWGKVIASQRVD